MQVLITFLLLLFFLSPSFDLPMGRGLKRKLMPHIKDQDGYVLFDSCNVQIRKRRKIFKTVTWSGEQFSVYVNSIKLRDDVPINTLIQIEKKRYSIIL